MSVRPGSSRKKQSLGENDIPALLGRVLQVRQGLDLQSAYISRTIFQSVLSTIDKATTKRITLCVYISISESYIYGDVMRFPLLKSDPDCT